VPAVKRNGSPPRTKRKRLSKSTTLHRPAIGRRKNFFGGEVMKNHSLCWVGLFALTAALFTADRASAQIYGVGGPSPFGLYGPYNTRPFGTVGLYGPGFSGLYGVTNPGLYGAYGLGTPGLYGSYGLGTPGLSAYYGYNPYAFSQNPLAGQYNPYLNALNYPGYRSPVELYGLGVSPVAPLSSLNAYYGGGYIPPVGINTYSSLYPPAQATLKISDKLNKSAARVSSVQVKVPSPDAEVWFAGIKTKQSGLNRDFVTPELEPGKNYKYQVRAIWKDKGVEVEQNRTINFQSGQNVMVDFTGPPMTEQKTDPGKK
jgi:uncharacterized protein (TIGR03000 family)